MEGSLSFFSLFSSLSLPLRLRLLSRRNMSCPHLRLLLMLSFCYILFSLKYKVLLPCSQNDSLLCVLRTRFISFLLGFHFCLYFTLPGIFSPQSLKSYLLMLFTSAVYTRARLLRLRPITSVKPRSSNKQSNRVMRTRVNIMIIMTRSLG